MANKIKGITIQIGADTLGLDSALKGIEQKSKKVTDELKDVNKTIKITGDSAAMWEQKQKLLNTALEESKRKLKLLEDAQEQVNKQFKDNKIGEEQYRAFQREVEYAKSSVDKYEKELAEAKEKVLELGKASDTAGDEIKEFGKDAEDAGDKSEITASGGITALKVALGVLVAEGIKIAARELKDFTKDVVQAGMTFESSMSSVAAISGATTEELDLLEQKAKEMGATTKYTAAESADAFGYMALAGWKVEDMLAGIDGVLNLAAASNMDLAKASDIVTDYLTAFGLTAEDSAHFVDIMTYAMANSNTTTELLGEAYKNCAATAASMGYSVEDTTAVLMTMANAGVKGGEAGTALNAIMTRLATDTKGCASELAEYNVNVYDAEGNMQSLSSILEGVAGHWETLTDQEQAALAKSLAGTNHYAALQTIMNGLSASAEEAGMSFNDYTTALEECDGAAQDMSTTMIDNLQGDITILESAIDGMKLSLSDELNPVLRDATQFITKEIPNVEKVLKPIFQGASKAINFVIDNIPAATSVIKRYALPVLEILGGAIKNAWELGTKLLGALPGIGNFIRAVKEEKLLNELTEDSRALADSVQADIDKMKELSSTAREQTEVDLAKVYKTESLYKELQELVDENGKVKRGYEERVNYIVKELSEATGTEIQLIDGVIQKYGELQTAIHDTIQKQKAEIFERNYAELYGEALSQNAQAAGKIVDAQKQRSEAKAIIDEYNNKIKRIFAGEEESTSNPYLTRDFTYEEIGEANLDKIGTWKNWGVLEDEDLTRLEAALINLGDSSTAYLEERAAVNRRNQIIEQYEKAEEALANGNYSLAQGLFAGIDNSSIASFGEVNKDNIDEAVDYYKSAVDEIGEKIEQVRKTEISNGDTAIKAEITTLVSELEAKGIKGADAVKTGIIDKLSEIDSFDTSAISSFMKQLGIDLGDILDESLRTRLLYFQNDLINEYSINSESDARYWREHWKDTAESEAYFRSLGWHASGGYIGIGQEGIVAEAGPELLQVMNGGVKITPLSRTATNTPVSAAGGDTIIQNFHNNINAYISNDYDVSRMAEKLATEEKRNMIGKGR